MVVFTFLCRPEFPSGFTFCHPKEHLVKFFWCKSPGIKFSQFSSGGKKKSCLHFYLHIWKILSLNKQLQVSKFSLSTWRKFHCLLACMVSNSFLALLSWMNGMKWKVVSLGAFQILLCHWFSAVWLQCTLVWFSLFVLLMTEQDSWISAW